MRARFIVVAFLALTACKSQSRVQGDYVADREDCQSFAERNIDYYLPPNQPTSDADRNAEMVTLFSNCMGQRGWQVAKPKKTDEVATTAPNGSPSYPNGYPSGAAAATVIITQQPPAAAAAAPPAAAAAAPAPSPETTPMGNQYSPSPPPATYQPMYGTGPGRNF